MYLLCALLLELFPLFFIIFLSKTTLPSWLDRLFSIISAISVSVFTLSVLKCFCVLTFLVFLHMFFLFSLILLRIVGSSTNYLELSFQNIYNFCSIFACLFFTAICLSQHICQLCHRSVKTRHLIRHKSLYCYFCVSSILKGG